MIICGVDSDNPVLSARLTTWALILMMTMMVSSRMRVALTWLDRHGQNFPSKELQETLQIKTGNRHPLVLFSKFVM